MKFHFIVSILLSKKIKDDINDEDEPEILISSLNSMTIEKIFIFRTKFYYYALLQIENYINLIDFAVDFVFNIDQEKHHKKNQIKRIKTENYRYGSRIC